MNQTSKRINFYISEDQVERLHKMKLKTGIPLSEMARRAIDFYLLKEELKLSEKQ